MARSQKRTAIILDVGWHTTSLLSNGQSKIEIAKERAADLIAQKMLTTKGNQVSITTFGSDDTKNRLHTPTSDYSHINVLTDGFEIMDTDLIRKVQGIQAQRGNSDVISALIIALDELYCDQKKLMASSVFLFTDLSVPVRDPRDLSIIIEQMKTQGTDLIVVAMDLADASSPLNDGHRLFQAACQTLGGVSRLVAVSNSMELMKGFRTRLVAQTTKARTPLELTPNVHIPVWICAKTSVLKPPTLKKRDKAAPAYSPGDVDRKTVSYAAGDATKTPLAPGELVKGYRYGKQIVPVGEAEERLLKLSPPPEKCLQVLCAVPISSLNRAWLMGTTDAVYTPPEDPEESRTALAALVRAMEEARAALLCRFVSRAGLDPKLVVLTPSIKRAGNDEEEQDGDAPMDEASTQPWYVTHPAEYTLTLNILPFAEDMRALSFLPLPQPSDEQQALMDSLVDNMDLHDLGDATMTTFPEENNDGRRAQLLDPALTFNPSIQRLFECVKRRALDPTNLELPDLKADMDLYLQPEQIVAQRLAQTDLLPQIVERFALKQVEQGGEKGKKGRTFWREVAIAKEASLKEAVAKRGGDLSLVGLINNLSISGDGGHSQQPSAAPVAAPEVKPEPSAPRSVEIGTVNPVRDFERAVADSSQDLVVPSMHKLVAVIDRFLFGEEVSTAVANGTDGISLMKAVESIAALRKAAVQELEPAIFNSFIRDLKARVASARNGSPHAASTQRLLTFWTDRVVQRKLTLVHSDEVPNSTVSPKESDEFLQPFKDQAAPAPVAAPKPVVASVVEDDLLDLIE